MNIATSASGRAYFAALDAAYRRSMLADLRTGASKGWAARKARLDKAVQQCEALGYCSSFQEWHPDIDALGFSLRGPRGELYAVSCGGPAYRLPADLLISRVAPKLLQIQQAIAREVGTAPMGVAAGR